MKAYKVEFDSGSSFISNPTRIVRAKSAAAAFEKAELNIEKLKETPYALGYVVGVQEIGEAL